MTAWPRSADPRRVGWTEDGKPVFDGGDVFRLMDTYGIPLCITQEALRGRGGFDAVAFAAAALRSGNFSQERLRSVLAIDGGMTENMANETILAATELL